MFQVPSTFGECIFLVLSTHITSCSTRIGDKMVDRRKKKSRLRNSSKFSGEGILELESGYQTCVHSPPTPPHARMHARSHTNQYAYKHAFSLTHARIHTRMHAPYPPPATPHNPAPLYLLIALPECARTFQCRCPSFHPTERSSVCAPLHSAGEGRMNS